jgi:enoyl-CoA hydratase/carnithine racemase
VTHASTDILARNESGITTIAFNRMAKKNSITDAMYARMASILIAAAADASVRTVVFEGNETIFTAGNDIGSFLEKPPEMHDSPVFRFIRALANFPKPIVAAVCGPAVGIGTTMLFHCDLVYAGYNATFSMPFADLGLCPEAASSLLAPQLMGYRRAAEALLLGTPLSAISAFEAGLVNRVLPPLQCRAYAHEKALELGKKPLASLIETKRLMKGSQAQAVIERIGEEGFTLRRMLKEPAAQEAFAAFFEKRPPNFSSL